MDIIGPIVVSTVLYYLASIAIGKHIVPPASVQQNEKTVYLAWHLSFVHTFASILTSSIVLIINKEADRNTQSGISHFIVIGVINIKNSLGYFIVDSVHALYYNLHDSSMRLHHLISLLALSVMYFSSINGSAMESNVFILGILFAEISNPSLLKRYILKAEGKQNTAKYMFYEVSFVILFTTGRVVLGTWYLVKVWNEKMSMPYIFLSVAVYALSWFWFFIILAKALKLFKNTNILVLKVFILGVNYVKGNKLVLALTISLISFALPTILNHLLKNPSIMTGENSNVGRISELKKDEI